MTPDKEVKKRAALHEKHAKWHVFYVQTRHEKVAAIQLERDGYEVYLPLKKELKVWSQRKKWVEEPLFKSYLFIRVPETNVYEVLQHPKVLSYIRYNGKPASIRTDHLELIKQMVSDQTRFDIEEKTLEVGQRIQFESGPFRGHFGVILEKRGSKKAVIRLEQLDYQLVVEL